MAALPIPDPDEVFPGISEDDVRMRAWYVLFGAGHWTSVHDQAAVERAARGEG